MSVSRPKYVTSPAVLWITPHSRSISVVLPAPFAPISAVAKPFGNSSPSICRVNFGYFFQAPLCSRSFQPQ